MTTLFDAVEEGRTDPEDIEIWTPRSVVEELVRQWPERAERMSRVLGSIKHDLASFGLRRPSVPEFEPLAVERYRERLEERLTGPGRKVADHPASIGKAIDWAAQHRFPIRAKKPEGPGKNQPDLRLYEKPKTAPITGVVDAAIWLTVAEAAAGGNDVAVITQNTSDFADGSDKSKLHLKLIEEIRAAGGDPAKVALYRGVQSFNDKHVQQSAEDLARDFLENNRSAVLNQISDASEWLPVTVDAEWGLDVDVEEATLASFEPSTLSVLRADEAKDGFFVTVEARGEGRLDLVMWKFDAIHVPEGSPVSVYDYDFNESMAGAEAELSVKLTVEMRVKNGDFDITIERVSAD